MDWLVGRVAVGFGSRSSLCLVWVGFRSDREERWWGIDLTSTQMNEGK